MAIPTDTLFSQQWYLRNTTLNEYDLNVSGVWDDYTGKGVKVMVVDDGFDYLHPDLAPNYDTAADYDLTNGDGDPLPGQFDWHGTCVMGILGAARDDAGMVGVAYGATLIGARVEWDSPVSELFMVQWIAALDAATADGIDVVNMSFNAGLGHSFDQQFAIAQTNAATQRAVEEGRDGLGAILVRSAGNFGPWPDMPFEPIPTNGNEFNDNTHQIVVGGINRDGFASDYSSEGAHILVSAFGSPQAGEIVTTDIRSTGGYSSGDYNMAFNGTSAAAAMVSGVVALMLEANARLGWRDVQTILAHSARHVGSPIDGSTVSSTEGEPWRWNGATNWNGGALHFSQDYGYGLVDAQAAVHLAESWVGQRTSANEMHASVDFVDEPTPLDEGGIERTFTATLDEAISVERVTVTLDALAGEYWPASRDVTIEVLLTSPDGEVMNLSTIPIPRTYYGPVTYHSQAMRGELGAGEWKVRIICDDAEAIDQIHDLKVNLFGSAASKNSTYFYTDEFATFVDTHSTTLEDTDGGKDLLNAAAVSGDMTVDFAKGTGEIDGVDIVIKGIENVFGGSGDDMLTGGKTTNQIAGGRGLDTMTGGGAADIFLFSVIKDSLVGAADLIRDFGNGRDRINLSGIDTSETSGDQAFRFIGTKDFAKAGDLHLDILDQAGTRNDLTIIEADLDGDGTADFELTLAGVHRLAKSDFAL